MTDPGEAFAVVVPCYNAGARVRPVAESLAQRFRRVIIVDDGSTDGAADALRDLSVRIETFPENRGKGFAIIAGFRAALEAPDVQYVAVIDADGQHDPAELERLFEAAATKKADLVIGSRNFHLRQVPWTSWFGNRLTALLTRTLFGTWVTDTQSGFRVHARRLAQDVCDTLPGGRYETEMAILVKAMRGPYTVVSEPISTIYEEGNPSSHFNRLRDSVKIYWCLVSLAFRRR